MTAIEQADLISSLMLIELVSGAIFYGALIFGVGLVLRRFI